jgi:hypothetical protein
VLPLDGEKDSEQAREVRAQVLLPSHRRRQVAESRHFPVLYVLCAVRFMRGVVPPRYYGPSFDITWSTRFSSGDRESTQDMQHQAGSASPGQYSETMTCFVATISITPIWIAQLSNTH